MIIVTGGAGFIGSNLVHELNSQGEDAILIVDNLSDAANPHKKFVNLAGARFVDYMDKTEFRQALANGHSRRAGSAPFCTRAPVRIRWKTMGGT